MADSQSITTQQWWRERETALLHFPPPLPHKMENMAGPAYTNWLIKSHVLLGPHPGAISTEELVSNLSALLHLGVTTFVCLQHDMQSPSATAQKNLAGSLASRKFNAYGSRNVVTAKPYFEQAQIIARHSHFPQVESAEDLSFIHFPISEENGGTAPDEDVKELVLRLLSHIKAGEMLYIQCSDGDGKTGTIGAILLGLVYGMSSSEALDAVQQRRNHRAGAAANSPQTHEQKMQVHRILTDSGFRQLAVQCSPARSSQSRSALSACDLSEITHKIALQIGRKNSFGVLFFCQDLWELDAVWNVDAWQQLVDRWRLSLTKSEHVLLHHYVTSGQLTPKQLVQMLPQRLTPFRARLVDQVFDVLNEYSNDWVSLDDLASKFRCEGHPDARAGTKTLEQVTSDFIRAIELVQENGRVTREQLRRLYEFVSAATDDDNYFELQIWGCWPMEQASHAQLGTAGLKSDDAALTRYSVNATAIGGRGGARQAWFKSEDSAPVSTQQQAVQSHLAVHQSMQDIIAALTNEVQQFGDTFALEILVNLHAHDEDSDLKVNSSQFVAAFRTAGVKQCSERTLLQLFEQLHAVSGTDRGLDGNPAVDIDSIAHAVCGELSPSRHKTVTKAFETLAPVGANNVPLHHLLAQYDASKHPIVLSARESSEDNYNRFVNSLISLGTDPEKPVYLDDFIQFCRWQSWGCADDAHFQLLLWNTWNLAKPRTSRSIRPATVDTLAVQQKLAKTDRGYLGSVERLSVHSARQTPVASSPQSRHMERAHFSQDHIGHRQQATVVGSKLAGNNHYRGHTSQSNDTPHSRYSISPSLRTPQPLLNAFARPSQQASYEQGVGNGSTQFASVGNVGSGGRSGLSSSDPYKHSHVQDGNDLAFGRDNGRKKFNDSVTFKSSVHLQPHENSDTDLRSLRQQFLTADRSNGERLNEQVEQQQVWQEALEEVRQILVQRGLRALVALCRELRQADPQSTGSITVAAFRSALRAHSIALHREYFDALQSEFVGEHQSFQYERFIDQLRGQLPASRYDVVCQAFQRLDSQQSGFVHIDDIRMVYNSAGHPLVRSGSRSEADVLREFLETFEVGNAEGFVTLADFLGYYATVSPFIDDDNFFRLMVWNTWDLQAINKSSGAAGVPTVGEAVAASTQPHEQKDSVSSTPQDFTASSRYGWGVEAEQYDTSTDWHAQPMLRTADPSQMGLHHVVERIRVTLARRGARSLLALHKALEAADIAHNGSVTGVLELHRFGKVMVDCGVAISDAEIIVIGRDCGLQTETAAFVQYLQFLQHIRGSLSAYRNNLVQKAFEKLDHSRQGAATVFDVCECYNPTHDGDVRSGAKSPQKALEEFLSAFDLSIQDAEGALTRQQFTDYYTSVSATIDDDNVFQLMLWNTWELSKPRR